MPHSSLMGRLDTFLTDASGAVGAVTGNEALAHLRRHLLIIPAALAWRPRQPGIKATAGHTERLAHHRHRPGPSVLRHEAEFDIDAFTP